jgi:hypothetical protein
MTGPFETERQAAAMSLWETHGRQAGQRHAANVADLAAEIGAARITLGAYDRRVVEWLAGWDPSTVAVVCGLISRARQAAGQQWVSTMALAGDDALRTAPAVVLTANQTDCLRDMLADAISARTEGVAGDCDDCDTDPAGLCWDHSADLDRAEAYKALAAGLGVEVPS